MRSSVKDSTKRRTHYDYFIAIRLRLYGRHILPAPRTKYDKPATAPIGGTKCGALIGEAVVIPQKGRIPHFFTTIKQHGALLAKGWLLGTPFDVLFSDGLYERIGRPAIESANVIRQALKAAGYTFYIPTVTNQIFVIMANQKIEALSRTVAFSRWEPYDADHTIIRLATSWATTKKDTDSLIACLRPHDL